MALTSAGDWTSAVMGWDVASASELRTLYTAPDTHSSTCQTERSFSRQTFSCQKSDRAVIQQSEVRQSGYSAVRHLAVRSQTERSFSSQTFSSQKADRAVIHQSEVRQSGHSAVRHLAVRGQTERSFSSQTFSCQKSDRAVIQQLDI